MYMPTDKTEIEKGIKSENRQRIKYWLALSMLLLGETIYTPYPDISVLRDIL